MKRRARALAVLVGAAALSCAQAARAQGIPGLGPTFTPQVPQQYESTPETDDPKQSSKSVKLFDGRRATQGLELDLGPVWYRKRGRDVREGFDRGTGEILVGSTTTTPWGPFFLTGLQQTHFRWLDSKSFAWTVLASYLGVGARIGPLEPEVRIGLGLLTIDAFHGQWSGELLTPRVTAGLGLHAGKIRVDIQAHSEYLWRWFGPDYLIRGVSLGLRLDFPRPKGPVFSDTPR